MSQLRRNIKFRLQHYCRQLYYQKKTNKFGDRIFIEKNVSIMRYTKNVSLGSDIILKEGCKICCCNESAIISIGERTTIGYNTIIFSSESIIIGKDCLIAPNVYIVDSNHGIEKGTNINKQKNNTAPISIGDDVWIASGVTILSGITIGTGAVVAANSVVNKSISEYEIFAGSPAKKIGERK